MSRRESIPWCAAVCGLCRMQPLRAAWLGALSSLCCAVQQAPEQVRKNEQARTDAPHHLPVRTNERQLRSLLLFFLLLLFIFCILGRCKAFLWGATLPTRWCIDHELSLYTVTDHWLSLCPVLTLGCLCTLYGASCLLKGHFFFLLSPCAGYSDGISESQFPAVGGMEIHAIREVGAQPVCHGDTLRPSLPPNLHTLRPPHCLLPCTPSASLTASYPACAG